MKFIKIYTGKDNKSHFTEVNVKIDTKEILGNYSKKYAVTEMRFRDFEEGAVFNWHNAPRPQYIIYLAGKVEIEASNGEKRIFIPGDVLFATDLTGKGHITKTLTKGRSIIIAAKKLENEPT